MQKIIIEKMKKYRNSGKYIISYLFSAEESGNSEVAKRFAGKVLSKTLNSISWLPLSNKKYCSIVLLI